MILKNVRCSFLFIENPNKNGKFGVQVIIPKDDPQVKAFEKRTKKALVEKHGEGALKKIGMYKMPLRDGDEERDAEEYVGQFFFNANNKRKPGVVNRYNKTPSEEELQELCFSGAYFHVSVDIYGYDKPEDGGKPGVAVSLKNLMLREAGDRLDGSTTASQDFAEFAEEGEDDLDDLDDF